MNETATDAVIDTLDTDQPSGPIMSGVVVDIGRRGRVKIDPSTIHINGAYIPASTSDHDDFLRVGPVTPLFGEKEDIPFGPGNLITFTFHAHIGDSGRVRIIMDAFLSAEAVVTESDVPPEAPVVQ